MSTRERVWSEIKAKHPQSAWLGVWASTDLISQIPEDEWREMHTGACATCGATARMYAGGWACDDHKPGSKA